MNGKIPSDSDSYDARIKLKDIYKTEFESEDYQIGLLSISEGRQLRLYDKKRILLSSRDV